jgi:ribosome recycling factor
MIKTLLKDAEAEMKKVVDTLKSEYATIRTGRATPSLLDRVVVECYGTTMPVNQVATITAPEPKLLLIQAWDKGLLSAIEKGIQKSDLGLVPNNDGSVIRIVIPHLTEERRKELVKLAAKEAEDKRVSVRNIRRNMNEALKKLEKSGDISEDDMYRAQDEVQELTDKYIEIINGVFETKQKEIMEI